jgi:nicotinate-nucleotide--dimethylbenzimidazole phosphoribosyltransferase
MPTASGLPFDDIRALASNLPGPHEPALAATRAREAQLLKPAGALGQLEEIAAWLSGWLGSAPPRINRPLIAVFAASHGVGRAGVSAYPVEVTAQMLEAYAAGHAAINQLALSHGAGLKVFDVGVADPTPDIRTDAAMSERDCAATIAFGMEPVAERCDCLILGEMGIGNSTVAAALAASLFGGTGRDWAGRGTGIDDAGLARKVAAIDAALAFHGEALRDPLEALRRTGGREFAAIAGAILAARHQRIPVILDGFAVTAAAAVLFRLNPSALDHCIAGHRSAEQAHGKLLDLLGLKPLLDLGMRLGEGTGAALALHILRAACGIHSGMGTFADAGVSGKA